jgi:LacI family transcriptional regulator
VTEHLLELGHRRIAFVTWADAPADSIERRATFLAVMAEAGLDVPPEYVRGVEPQYNQEYTDPEVLALSLDSDMRLEFYEPARQLLLMPERPTAVFACDDRVARDVLLAARDLGIRVPEELSVVGFDDIPESARFDPPLTTVRQPLVEMGAAATRLLLAMLAGEDVAVKTHLFEPTLTVRKSTGPPVIG